MGEREQNQTEPGHPRGWALPVGRGLLSQPGSPAWRSSPWGTEGQDGRKQTASLWKRCPAAPAPSRSV